MPPEIAPWKKIKRKQCDKKLLAKEKLYVIRRHTIG